MKAILVDSNVLIDFFKLDSEWNEWAESQIYKHSGTLIINPIIYAEVSLRFADESELNKAIPPSVISRQPLPWNAAFPAARAFMQYRKNGGAKTSVMPDFYIGAHAMVKNIPLLTRDLRRYKTYFPGLELITP